MKKKLDALTTSIFLSIFFAVYLTALFKITIFKYPIALSVLLKGETLGIRTFNLVPFYTIYEYIQFILTGRIFIGLSNLAGNFIIFFPFGYLTALKFPKTRKFLIILSLSFVLSLFIETIQYVSASGAADIDDVILNTAGGIAGYLAYILIKKLLAPEKYAVIISAIIVAGACAGVFVYDAFAFNHPKRNIPRTTQRVAGDTLFFPLFTHLR